MRNFLLHILFVVTLVTSSCSTSHIDEVGDVVTPDIAVESVVIGSDEVAFSASTTYTRTAIDDVDSGSVKWLTGDKVHLWAYSSEVEKISNVEFSLKYYGADYNDAIFIGNVAGLTDPESVDYTYYAVHPTPNSVSGTTVSYYIPISQNGRYDETSCDPMYATPSVAPAMQMGEKSSLDMSFRHMAHILRLQIPDDRYNLDGTGVTSLSIEFPEPIANGDLSFDYMSGEIQDFSGTSNSITVTLDEPTQGTGNYIWVFISPQTVTGDIKFRFYSDNDHASNLITTTLTDYEFKSGYVTPIDVTVPDQVDLTEIRLSLVGNNLGENPTSVTLTAPSGTEFFGGESSITYEYIDDVAYEYSVMYETPLYESKFVSGGISVIYDTPNTIVSSSIALSDVQSNKVNQYSDTLPYVLFEDFSSISYFSYKDNPGVGTWDSDAAEGINGVDLSSSSYGSLATSGWTANRTGAQANTALRIMGRYESGGSLITGHYEGRLDSPAFAIIKDNAAVDLEVSFNYKGGRYSKYYEVPLAFWNAGWVDGGSGTGTFNYGYTTETGGLSGEDEIENEILSSYEIIPDTEGGYSSSSQNYNNISLSRTFTIPDATNATRASWRVTNTMEDTNFLGANGNFWLYIDNIKVQIKSD